MKAEYYVGHRQAAAAAAAVCSACQFSTSVSGSTAGLAIKIGINSKQTINPLFLCLITVSYTHLTLPTNREV